MMIIGLFTVYQQSAQLKWDNLLLITIIIGNIAIPIVFGWLRAKLSHLFIGPDELVMRKGTWLTLLLWFIYAIIRGVINYWVKDSESFMLVSLSLSLLIQREMIWRSAIALFPNQIKHNESLSAH